MNAQYQQLSNEQVWEKFRQGDDGAFGELYERLFNDLYRYGYQLSRNHLAVQDCLHDLFLYLHQHRSTIGAAQSVKFYLMRALRRRMAHTSHEQAHLVLSSDDEGFEFEGIIPPEGSPEDEWVANDAANEQQRTILGYVNQLPKRQREALYLLYYGGMTHTQIAETMGVKIETVYAFLHRAMEFLRLHLLTLLFVLWFTAS